MNGISMRFPRYFRYLRELLMNGVLKVSSNQLAERLGITPSQVRADFSRFDGVGQHGYGYNVKSLYREISREIGVGDGITAAIFGGGNETFRLLSERFEGRGVSVISHICNGEKETLCTETTADIAVILEMPLGMTAEKLTGLGYKGIWNMTQTDIKADVPVLNLPVGDPLMTLCYQIKNPGKEGGK